MQKILDVGRVPVFADKYCNVCRFRKYINRSMKYCCALLGGAIEHDGANFIRPQRCIDLEVPDEKTH